MTPNLDGLAQESAVFTHAYAQAPLTPVSHASILTGTYPQFHQVIDFTYRWRRTCPTRRRSCARTDIARGICSL